jgi:hypothetical protein
MEYPINYHVLAEDFRDKPPYTQEDAKWLHTSLTTMCDAYDRAGFWVVGVTEGPKRLAICQTQEQAEQYVGTLPNAEDGRYYIDGPCPSLQS